MAGNVASLVALQAEQAGVQTGQPGGLGAAITDADRQALMQWALRSKPTSFRQAFASGPEEENAHNDMGIHIDKIIRRLIACKYFLKEMEKTALDWIEEQFVGRAADQWHIVVREASRIATVSGIGPQSVLWRALRDMLAAYPAHGVKAAILRRKVTDIVWSPTMKPQEIYTQFVQYYEAYDRAVQQTQTLNDVTMVVPAQDWATRFTEMQLVFPPWALQLVTNHPGRFTNMVDTWTALLAEASRQTAARKLGSGGRVHQLAMPDNTFMDGFDPGFSDSGLGAAGYQHFASGGIFAMPRVPGCWRCGKANHLRRDCDLPPSPAELQGLPMNQWAILPRLGPDARRAPPPRAPPPAVAQVAAVDDKVARLEAMVVSLLSHVGAAQTQPPAAGAPFVPANFAATPGLDVATTLAQVAAPAPPGPPPAPLVLGGSMPAGYLFVGHNHGVPVWGRPEIVEASIMDMGESENETGM